MYNLKRQYQNIPLKKMLVKLIAAYNKNPIGYFFT